MTPAQKIITLRFRDIELRKDETIRLHRQVISRHSYCWWGLLAREHERNPFRELRALHARLSQGESYPVALYDTNQDRVYRAECTEIEANAVWARSPEVDLTPSYYHDRPAPAWFRFTSIEDSSSALLLGRTCIELPSSNEECFTDLLGKTVTALRDLRRQEVTMWVLE